MKKNYIEVACIIDKSISMKNLTSKTIEGFNTYLNSLRENPADIKMSLVLFNTLVQTVFEDRPLSDVRELTTDDYVPDGCTAMNDAIGMTITKLGEKLASLAEKDKPEKVIVVILTDGEENSSVKYKDTNELNALIKQQQETYSWEFVYLAANQDAFKSGARYGFKKDNTFQYQATARGTMSAFKRMTQSTCDIIDTKTKGK